MGYDLYWDEQPEAVAEIGAKVRAAGGFHKADDALRDEYWAAEGAAGNYFRTSLSSMGPLREVMEARGMGHWERPTNKTIYDEDFAEFRIEGAKGIPLGKLCSNDGWLIHPEEITEALFINASQSTVTEADFSSDAWDLERWQRWLRFLRGAIEHGGVRVW